MDKPPPPVMPAAPPNPPPGDESCLVKTARFLGKPRRFSVRVEFETGVAEIPRRPEPIA